MVNRDYSSPKKAIYVLLGIISFSTPAEALDTTLRVGTTQWKELHEKLWVQRQYAHEEDYQSSFLAVGVHQKLTSRFGVALEVFSLGSYQTHADVTTLEDTYISGGRAAAGDKDAHCSTSGSLFGASLSITYNVNNWIEVSYGKTWYRQRFNVQIYGDWANGPLLDNTYHVKNDGWLFGLNYRIDRKWFVGGSIHFKGSDPLGDSYPSGMGDAFMFSIGTRR